MWFSSLVLGSVYLTLKGIMVEPLVPVTVNWVKGGSMS